MSRDITCVEAMGLEPTTSCLQSRCSSQLSYAPEFGNLHGSLHHAQSVNLAGPLI